MRRHGLLSQGLPWLLCLLAFLGLPAFATPSPIPLTAGTELADGSGHFAVLRDPGGQLSALDAATAHAEGRFAPVRRNPALGFTPDAAWIAVTLRRPPDSPARWRLDVQPPYLDDIQLHILREGQAIHQRAGDMLPLSQRANHNGALFDLDLPEGDTLVLLRVRSTSTLAVIPRIWSPRAFEENLLHTRLIHGLHFGTMLAVVLFNVINGVVTRRRICFLYSAYALSSAFAWWAINGFLAQFWLPESPLLANRLLPFGIAVNVLFAGLFYHLLLDVSAFPRIHRFYQFFFAVAAVTMVAALIGEYPRLAPWLYAVVLAWIPATLPPALQAWRSGRAEKRFAAIAYTVFGLLTAINVLTLVGAIDACMWSLIWTGQFSNLAHILLLHVAILLGLRRSDESTQAANLAALEARRDAQRQREASEEKSRFLSMITHEIRTPIAVISAASESLRILDTNTSPQRVERYDKIARAVQRMAQLVDLLLSRDASGADLVNASSLELAPVDLVSLTHEIIAQTPIGGDRLRVQAPALLPLAQADRRHLRFVLINLIDNALKYSTPDTAIEIRIAPHIEEGLPDEVEWRISNRGDPIPATQRERIFDKHARISETAAKPGLGLGLYLARHVVHEHGGRLFVDPQVVEGASFVLWLPTTPRPEQS